MTIPVRKLSNLILYSSLWIAACAAAQVQLTYDVLGIGVGFDAYTAFIFAATLALYSVHRIVGMEKVKAFSDQGRFAVIREYRSHIVLYGIGGAGVALWYVLQLPRVVQFWIALPVVMSAAYVLPIAKNRLRLRDVPVIKVFIIAIVWSMLVGVIPYVVFAEAHIAAALMIFGERALFILAITIPFDIRDAHVDETSGVRTLPHLLGQQQSKRLALLLLLASALINVLLITFGYYDARLWLPYSVFVMITSTLIWQARAGLDDHFFSGLLDGTMFLLPFLFWLFTLL